MKNMPKADSGFTLAELIVVLSIITTLSLFALYNVTNAFKRSRDARRIADIEQIRTALLMYKQRNNGALPEEQAGGLAGWEASTMTNFLNSDPGGTPPKSIAPFLPKIPLDPINKAPLDLAYENSFYYAYHYYGPGWAGDPDTGKYYGCNFNGYFAILAIRHIESMPETSLPRVKCGLDQDLATPEFDCPTGTVTTGPIENHCRDWGSEFDYSILLR